MTAANLDRTGTDPPSLGNEAQAPKGRNFHKALRLLSPLGLISPAVWVWPRPLQGPER